MARNPTPAEPKHAKLSAIEIDRGIARLTKRLNDVKAFDPQKLDRDDPDSTVRPLRIGIESALAETFGTETVEYKRFIQAKYFDWPIIIGQGIPHHERVEAVTSDRTRSIQLLEAAIELLADKQKDLMPVSSPALAPKTHSKRIFVVHGHDQATKDAASLLLTKLGLDPVVLHDQPNKGRTIIEKFNEEAADVGFAVVLMTPDDELASGQKRARQNVVLELGFFLGKLGRSRVVVLVKGAVEVPSDFSGVLFLPFDDHGAWKFLIGKELIAAGYTIDLHKAM